MKRFYLHEIPVEEIVKQTRFNLSNVEGTVNEILTAVQREGDRALLKYENTFDGFSGEAKDLVVTEEEIASAIARTDKYFIETLLEAKRNIAVYHTKQLRTGYRIVEKGKILGQIVNPLKRVGVYVPGGTAAYPSTVLMNVLPAVIAGVDEVVMATPAKDNVVPDAILVAARIAGVQTIYKMGGAQAIAALAYGTETIQKVDKIVGPGNAYVAAAKRAVYGQVAVDMIAGPSEILVLADATANPKFVAADLLSQAEHDKNASSILVTDSVTLAYEVEKEVFIQLSELPRKEIARASIDKNGKIIVCNDMTEAVTVANAIAPEHLELAVEEPFRLLPEIKNAGSIFLGSYAPEPLGDYFAGTNHTLPTSGTARFSSPLSVDDFVKKSSYIYYEKPDLLDVADRIIDFAEREGLSAHANALRVRKEDQ